MTRYLVVRHARAPFSFRVGAGSLLVVAGALVAILGVFCLAITSGSMAIAPADVAATLFGGGTEDSRFIVWTLRLPRVLTAILVGAALAISGLIFQSLTRNPLAAPDIIGINGGAALAVVAVIILGGSSALMAPAAFAGGLIAATCVYLLAWRGGIGRYRLILVGIGVAAITEAGIGYLLTRGDVWETSRAVTWMLGSLYASTWGDVVLMSVGLAVLIPATLLLGRGLTALQLGDDVARSIGAPTERTRLALVGVGVGLAALGVTVAGPVAFVAFIAPHLARRLARASGAGLIPASAAMGALLMLAADSVARRILDSGELPVGIITVILGAPYFLWLLARSNQLGTAA